MARAAAPCKRGDCTNPAFALGLCRPHYQTQHAADVAADSSRPMCGFDDCKRPATRKGLCAAHRSQMLKRGFLTSIGWQPPRSKAAAKQCSFEGCENLAAREGLCKGHAAQLQRGKGLTTLGSTQSKALTMDERLRRIFEKCRYVRGWMLVMARCNKRQGLRNDSV